ncbi:MAG: hypothetical protein HY421_01715 [Candidatus Kerfeldbacteria bacterium]|nr:hypothetical protein [Candidatus Kerfeldbacteria bacterium]
MPPPPVRPQPVAGRNSKRKRTWTWTVLVVLGAVLLGTGTWWYASRSNEASLATSSKEASGRSNGQTNTVLGSVSPKDADNDGLADELEQLYGTDVTKADTDGDGFDDGTEVNNGYEPRNTSKDVRMVDVGLVETLAKQVNDVSVISSGLSTATAERFYLAFDAISTVYYDAAGSVVAQCVPGIEPTGTCETLPNELRTDFSRVFTDGIYTDSYHVPF